MSEKISNLPAYSGAPQPSGDIPISIGGVTYKISPELLVSGGDLQPLTDIFYIIQDPNGQYFTDKASALIMLTKFGQPAPVFSYYNSNSKEFYVWYDRGNLEDMYYSVHADTEEAFGYNNNVSIQDPNGFIYGFAGEAFRGNTKTEYSNPITLKVFYSNDDNAFVNLSNDLIIEQCYSNGANFCSGAYYNILIKFGVFNGAGAFSGYDPNYSSNVTIKWLDYVGGTNFANGFAGKFVIESINEELLSSCPTDMFNTESNAILHLPFYAKGTNFGNYAEANIKASVPTNQVVYDFTPTAQVNSDWNAVSGIAEILNKPTIPSVGTWGALNYPNWSSGTPFIKMTADGIFDLDTDTYLTGITSGQVITALGFTPENTTNKGVANGYAGLNSSGVVPSSQLPSYVDDVLEYANLASFPSTGESGKIYIALDTNLEYRWSGSTYINIAKGDVQSVNTKTGAVVLNTDDIAESGTPTNKWWTNARSIGGLLTSFSAGAGTVSATDSILQAIQKIVGNINALVTGVSSVNTKTGAVTLTTADIADSTDKRYVTDALKSILSGIFIYKAATVSSSVTGTVSETLVYSQKIPANTLSSNDFLSIFTTVRNSNTATLKVKVGTTSSMPSGTTGQIGICNLATNFNFIRTFKINGTALFGYPFTTSSAIDLSNSGIGTESSIAFDITVDNWIFFSITLGNSLNSSSISGFKISNL